MASIFEATAGKLIGPTTGGTDPCHQQNHRRDA